MQRLRKIPLPIINFLKIIYSSNFSGLGLTDQQSFSSWAIWSLARRASTKLKVFSKNRKAARPRDTRESWPSGRPLQVDCAFRRVLLSSRHTRRSENMTSRIFLEFWNIELCR